VIGPELERPAKMPLSFAWKAPISAEKIGGFDFDFFPTPGRSRPDLSTGSLDMKTLNVFTTSSSPKSNLGLDFNIGTSSREKERLAPSFRLSPSKGRLKENTGLNMKDVLNVGSMLNIGTKEKSRQHQNQFNLFRQQQSQRQKTGFRFPSMKSPRLGFPVAFGGKRMNPFTTGKGFGFSLGGKGHGNVFTKAFYSDLLSVNYSVGRFGKATHPSLTRKNWAKAESSGFLNVPTVEMGRRNKRRRLI
jgi:hypothetical protein